MLAGWVAKEAPRLSPFVRVPDSPRPPSTSEPGDDPTLSEVLQNFEFSSLNDPEMTDYLRESLVSTSMSDHEAEDHFGVSHAGGWSPIQFILRSAVVMTLGATETFERGVIRTFLSYDKSLHNADRPVLKPDIQTFRNIECSAWRKIEDGTKIRTCKGRREILDSLLGREVPAGEPSFSRLNNAWIDRNDIVHALQPVTISLARFLEVHYDCYYWMRDLSNRCMDRVRVEI
jgi:hypothetical protein